MRIGTSEIQHQLMKAVDIVSAAHAAAVTAYATDEQAKATPELVSYLDALSQANMRLLSAIEISQANQARSGSTGSAESSSLPAQASAEPDEPSPSAH